MSDVSVVGATRVLLPALWMSQSGCGHHSIHGTGHWRGRGVGKEKLNANTLHHGYTSNKTHLGS